MATIKFAASYRRCEFRSWMLQYASDVHTLQGGTSANEISLGIDIGEDGSVILSGYTEGDWAGTNAGDWDFVAMKFSAEGIKQWTWQVRMN